MKNVKAEKVKAESFKRALGKQPPLGASPTSILRDATIESIKEEEFHTTYSEKNSFFTKDTQTAEKRSASSEPSKLGDSWVFS